MSKGIISAGHEETARAGQEILLAGGNAFDAALAAMLTSYVSEPSLTSMGGGGFMTAHTQAGENILFDFFVQTPQKRLPLDQVDVVESLIDFGVAIQKQYIGKGVCAVPGGPAGLFHIHERLGTLPLAEIARPAIELARKGVVITPYQEYTIGILEPILMYSESVREIFSQNGEICRAGDVVKNLRFADTLEYMCKEGRSAFYEGEIAHAFAQDNAATGGSVSLEDLRAYQVIERNPLAFPYHDHTFLTNPPPSAGGSMIACGLALLKESDLRPLSPEGAAYVRRLAGSMNGMEQFRSSQLTPRMGEAFVPNLNEASISNLSQGIDWLGNTTHISVIDQEGNAAAVTTTLGGAGGYTIPGTGIQINNMLGELDLNPGGLYQWEEDHRVTSMMSPSIVLKGGRPVIVLGSGGSSRIRSAILQVLVNRIDHGMDITQAVQYPRLHWEDHILNIEPGLLAEGETLDLSGTSITQWAEKNMFFGGVHAVVRTDSGDLDGVGDVRRGGACLHT